MRNPQNCKDKLCGIIRGGDVTYVSVKGHVTCAAARRVVPSGLAAHTIGSLPEGICITLAHFFLPQQLSQCQKQVAQKWEGAAVPLGGHAACRGLGAAQGWLEPLVDTIFPVRDLVSAELCHCAPIAQRQLPALSG